MNDESKVSPSGDDSPEIKARLAAPGKIEQRALQLIAQHDSAIDRLYNRYLSQEERQEATIIALNSIPKDVREKRRQQLQKKLDKYTDRLKKHMGIFGVSSDLETLYKRDVLRLVLERGSVNTYAYSNAVAEQLKAELPPKIFQDSCFVIDDYLKTGGENVESGGLPP